MQTDAQLVSATLNGDSDAFSALVERYKSRIHGLAISIVGNSSLTPRMLKTSHRRPSWRHILDSKP